MRDQLSLQQKLDVAMQGYNKQLTSLKETYHSAVSEIFQSALPPLTEVLAKTNDLVTAIGRIAQKKESVGKVISDTSLGAVAAGTAAAATLAAIGLYYGGKGLKGLGGIKGLLSGLGGHGCRYRRGKGDPGSDRSDSCLRDQLARQFRISPRRQRS